MSCPFSVPTVVPNTQGWGCPDCSWLLCSQLEPGNAALSYRFPGLRNSLFRSFMWIKYASMQTLWCFGHCFWLVLVRSVLKQLSFPHSLCDKTISHGGSNSPGWALLSWWELWCCNWHLNHLNSLMNNLVKEEKNLKWSFHLFKIYSNSVFLLFCHLLGAVTLSLCYQSAELLTFGTDKLLLILLAALQLLLWTAVHPQW